MIIYKNDINLLFNIDSERYQHDTRHINIPV